MSLIDNLTASIRTQVSSDLLTAADEIVLGNLIQSIDSDPIQKDRAINILVLKNIYLVIKLSHGYSKKAFELADIVGYGILGLFTAAKKFNPSKYSNRFASYARFWIRDAVVKARREYSGTPKIPVYLVKDLWAINRILDVLPDCTDESICKKTSLSLAAVQDLRSLRFKNVTLDASYMGYDITTPEDFYAEQERNELFHTEIERILTKDEYTVISHLCGLCNVPQMTFKEIEQVYNIKNARKIKVSALNRLESNALLKVLHKES